MSDRIRVVGYCRVSTEGQAEHGMGLQIQRDGINRFAQEHPEYELVKIYEDPGISGASLNRPGLNALLEDAKEKRFTKVIIAKLDRLARDLYIQLWVEKELLIHGIEVISLAEAFNGKDPMTTAMRQIVGVFAQLEKGRITERLQSGRLKKASLGGYAGGRLPRGYKTDEGKLRLNREATTVRAIRKLHRQGWALRRIARHLNEQSIPNSKGSQWYPATVRYIVHNPVYKGQIRYAGQLTRGTHPAMAPHP
ncbi:MAG: recombinase family protein [Elusimicrobiota bacterium]